MSRQPRNTSTATPASSTRMNEYFVPRDGIDREVISADICRYLGNDALVRPGHYENPQSGQTVQGYYITAYRNLTTAMIEDLKADSARWDSERRSQTSRNTPGVQYRYSETHQSRQHHGPTEHPPFQQQQQQQQDHFNSRDSFETAKYPGSGAPGYTGATGHFPQQQTYAQTTPGPSYGNYQQGPSGANPDPRYPSPANQPGLMNPGFQAPQEVPYVNTGAHMTPRYPPNDGFSGPRGGSSGPGPQQSMYSTSGPPQQGYPQHSGAPYQYSNQGPHPGSGQQYSSSIQPQDPFYGRASPAGPPPQPGYGAQGQQQQPQQQQNSVERHHRPPPPRR
ncbi:hypothetical protein LMH87_001880 [Akanthomyces muscarius]|uniref:Transcription factor RfeG n=1 Tax=Akanthomyces muscarius TaxID=2231603 RepID=A0A9W8Q784_AKAMU|nr:hypothetical protein LMH87_001880 [Akanthomyces muscarius]KAJ4147350.1 hypothetical protein LMH87_001880 [Akanthomyces muscarius]